MPYPPKHRKIFAAVLLAVCLSLCCNAQTRRYTISPRNAERAISEERIMAQIEMLSDTLCRGRQTGTGGATMAAAWISERYRHIGLLKTGGSYFRGFRCQGGATGRNIIGFFPGSHSHEGRYAIVMAHYDNLGVLGGVMYPGADSNASGVVSLLTIAEMLKYMNGLGKTYGKTVIFVCLDAKEKNMAGASSLWNMIRNGSLSDPVTGERITGDKIDQVINIDQVGSILSPVHKGRNDYLIMLTDEKSGRRGILESVNRQYALGMDISFSYYGSRDFTRIFYTRVSDQKVFVENKITSVMFTSGITMNNNKPYDVPSTIDIGVLRKRIMLMYYYLARTI